MGTPRRRIPTRPKPSTPPFFSKISWARRTKVRSISEPDINCAFCLSAVVRAAFFLIVMPRLPRSDSVLNVEKMIRIGLIPSECIGVFSGTSRMRGALFVRILHDNERQVHEGINAATAEALQSRLQGHQAIPLRALPPQHDGRMKESMSS